MSLPTFNLVVRALWVQDGALLVSRWLGSYCFAVGGRVEPGESLEQALLREFEEETGARADPIRLVYFHENFFGRDLAGGVHELGWYFSVGSDRPIGRLGHAAPHPDSEGLRLEYVPLDRLAKAEVRPRFLAEVLPADHASGFPAAPRHFVSLEDQAGLGGLREVRWAQRRRQEGAGREVQSAAAPMPARAKRSRSKAGSFSRKGGLRRRPARGGR